MKVSKIKKNTMKKRIIWFNFFRLMGLCFVFIVCAMLYIYHSSMTVMKQQFLQVNEQKASTFSNNMNMVVEQTLRIVAAIYVDRDSQIFFGAENPKERDPEIFERVYGKLKAYSYGLDYLSTIILYSPKYDRMADDKYALTIEAALKDKIYDTGWIGDIEEISEEDGVLMKIRAHNDRYPYLFSVMKKYKTIAVEGAVIVNIDLKKLYSVLYPEQNEHTALYVLDGEGRIVLNKRKKSLYEDRMLISELQNFVPSPEKQSVLVLEGSVPYTYTQEYNEATGLYFVVITKLEDYQSAIRKEQMKVILLFLGCTIGMGIFILLYSTTSFKPFQSILEILENPKNWKDGTLESESQVREITEKIIAYIQVNEELHKNLDEQLGILRDTQVQALQEQINPHFLFNTLAVIDTMLEDYEGECGRIGRIVEYLMDIMRYSLSGKELATLETELSYLQKYVYILECRYGNCFDVEIDFDPDIIHAEVPKLILQPLIENAVFHGIVAKGEEYGGRLSVRGCVDHASSDELKNETMIRIEIEDNGYGMTPTETEELQKKINDSTEVSSNHIGLSNTAKRLYLLFPGRAQIDIRSERNQGTCITLIFPKKHY